MLDKKQVGTRIVSQAGMREAIRRVGMLKEVQGIIERKEVDEETITALTIYPHIAGCITPVISIAEFLEMPETEIDVYSSAAMELNPHWFTVADSAEQEKKTDAIPIESTENLSK